MAAKTKSNGMELCFVVLMCLGTLANGQTPRRKQTSKMTVSGDIEFDSECTGFVQKECFIDAVHKGFYESINSVEGCTLADNINISCIESPVGAPTGEKRRLYNWKKMHKLEISYTVVCDQDAQLGMYLDSASSKETGTTMMNDINTEFKQSLLCSNFSVTTEPTASKDATCKCIYDGKTLPESAWADAKNPLFGTYCSDWNQLVGVKDQINYCECPPTDKCTKKCNFLYLPWCFVETGCEGADHSPTSVIGLSSGVSYSYAVCGAPTCGPNNWDDVQCPAGRGCDNQCHCLFEGKTLPDDTAAKAGNPLYGTNCDEAWDVMPGTKYYNDGVNANCFGEEADECSRECNWRHGHFCFVEVGCDGLETVDVIKSEWSNDLKAAAGVEGDVGYSYVMCQHANCHAANFDHNPECPFGAKCLTCGMAKRDYKTEDCCGNPEKKITIHHMYHKMGEFH